MPVVPSGPFSETFLPSGPGCCGHRAGHFTSGLLPMPGLVGDAAAEMPREPPQILLIVDSVWRNACLQRVGQIPAGYTDLAQLMGHDMGNSVAVDAHPHVAPVGSAPLRRYNVIENPLCLETIYGARPIQPGALYDPETLLFRLQPGAVQAALIAFRPDPASNSLRKFNFETAKRAKAARRMRWIASISRMVAFSQHKKIGQDQPSSLFRPAATPSEPARTRPDPTGH